MAKYNYFFTSSESDVTPIGSAILAGQNTYFFGLITRFSSKKDLTELSLLEIGPGKGAFARTCQEKGVKYQAIEENEIGAQKLQDMGIKVTHASVPPIPGKKKYDVIFMNQVLEHMQTLDQVTALMQEFSDRLSDDGILVLGCPDILTHKEHFYNDYTHSYPTSIIRLRRLYQDFGLTPVYDKYYTFFFRGFFLTRVITVLTLWAKSWGILDLVFGKKSDKVLSSLLPSFVIIGKKSS